jgi:hypothetical protein
MAINQICNINILSTFLYLITHWKSNIEIWWCLLFVLFDFGQLKCPKTFYFLIFEIQFRGRWALGSLALIQLYGFKELTKLLKLSKLPCFKGIIPCLDHLSTSNIFLHLYLDGHAPYSLEALKVDVVWLFKKEACFEHSFKFQACYMYFFGNVLKYHWKNYAYGF